MKKKDLLSKLSLKDYNNKLEEVLEKKDFLSDVKNLLLSMLYKIETGYEDYKTVKQDVVTKNALIESTIGVIDVQCDKIELIKPISSEEENLKKKFEIFEAEKKLVCYPSESYLFAAILALSKKEFNIGEEYNIFKNALKAMLENGYDYDRKEIVEDFDGWTWNININKDEVLLYNLIYQNIKFLLSGILIYEWKRDRRSEKDYLHEVRRISEIFYISTLNACLLKISQDEKEREYIYKEKEKLEKELSDMEDKTNFLKDIYDEKKILTDKIRVIDAVINDQVLIMQEFEDRNKHLKEDERIFSVSDLDEMLQKERNEHIEQLARCNHILDPKNYIEKKACLKEKIKIVDNLDLNEITKDKIDNSMISLQEVFLDCLKYKIEKVETKEEIKEILYKYRYYKHIKIDYNGKIVSIKDIEKLNKKILSVDKDIITKACKLKVVPIINKNIEFNFVILSRVLGTKIINLDEIIVDFKISSDEKELLIDIYDSEILDKTEKLELDKKEEFNIKFNKKMKLML